MFAHSEWSVWLLGKMARPSFAPIFWKYGCCYCFYFEYFIYLDFSSGFIGATEGEVAQTVRAQDS
jgi:hypothetical protein